MSRSKASKPSAATVLFSLFALGITACGSPMDPEDGQFETESQSIVNGTLTYARPEVIQFGGCTATLLSPTTFLTAAHCIGYYPEYRRPSELYITDSNGEIHDGFWSDRSFSQGTGPDAEDWAVGMLNTPVPSNIATPATISDTYPQNEWVTAMGFGCTDRNNPNVYVKGKRYKEYFYNGSSTHNLCWGDSGGPLFRGLLNSGGPIVRIHSAIGDGGSASGKDYYADAVTYRQHIRGLSTALQTQGICYRSYVEGHWLPAVCNNTISGVAVPMPGSSPLVFDYRTEAMQIWSIQPGVLPCYQAYVQGKGWLTEVCDGVAGGTMGESRRMEAIKVRLAGTYQGGVAYCAYVQGIGWTGPYYDGAVAGTLGRRINALAIRFGSRGEAPRRCP